MSKLTKKQEDDLHRCTGTSASDYPLRMRITYGVPFKKKNKKYDPNYKERAHDLNPIEKKKKVWFIKAKMVFLNKDGSIDEFRDGEETEYCIEDLETTQIINKAMVDFNDGCGKASM